MISIGLWLSLTKTDNDTDIRIDWQDDNEEITLQSPKQPMKCVVHL
jgi:hypothetical protein